MDTIEQACILNNDGVHLMVLGDSKSCIALFQDALSILKDAVSHVQGFNNDEILGTCDTDQDTSLDLLKPSERVIVIDAQHESKYTYSSPFFLAKPATSEFDMEDCLQLYCATVLFHLALAYHQDGKVGMESSLKRASHLYSMSLRLLNDSSHLNASKILAVAALNNKAAVQFELCDYSHSRCCLRALTSLLNEVHPIIQDAFLPSVLEGFLLNSITNESPIAARAA